MTEEENKPEAMYWLGAKTSAVGDRWLSAETGVGRLMNGSLDLLKNVSCGRR